MRHNLRSLVVVLLLGVLASAAPARAREEWFRGLDLEAAVGGSDLILVVRVAEVGESKIVSGGKAEYVMQQFTFQPLRTLKGVFTRDALQLTTEDLGGFDGQAHLERGAVRLLMLGRSGRGYVNQNQQGGLDRSVPPLKNEDDPLLAAVKVLIGVTQQHDREKKVTLLVEGLREAKGPAAVPLLAALGRRALLAAQTEGTAGALTRHLGDDSPAVREAAAHALYAVLDADYLEHRDLREGATTALAAALGKADGGVTVRVAALDALGSAGEVALKTDAAASQLKADRALDTFAERAALLRAVGRLKADTQRDAVRTFFEQLPLDAPEDVRQAAGRALVRLDADAAQKAISQRMQKAYAAGLGVGSEIALLGELPAAAAVPALLDAVKLALNANERVQFAHAAEKLADARLVPALAGMLDPRQHGVRWHAVQALIKINTPAAAIALQPHLREEADLLRKLQIAEMLGRHGIRDGYPYAMEHLSEPGLLEQAVAALAAIREPKAVPVLRDILKSSNDTAWNGVAIRALGALGDKEVAARCLEIVQDMKDPLAPAALVALGDLGEAKALPKVKEGLASRNNAVALASARAAGKLLARPEVKADDLRDQLAAVVADADAAQDLRAAALEALAALKDPRLDKALAASVRDAGLEGSGLLERTERLLRERKAKAL